MTQDTPQTRGYYRAPPFSEIPGCPKPLFCIIFNAYNFNPRSRFWHLLRISLAWKGFAPFD